MGIREQIRRPLHRVRPCVGAATVWIGLLSILLLFGFVNLYWRARPGSEEFASSLHTLSLATIGVGVDMRTPAESYPDRQYEFWQEAVDRILKAHPDDAGLYAAAALIFHEPCLLYTSDVAKDVADEDVRAVLFPREVNQRSDKLTRYQTITYQMRRILLEVRSDLERERGQVSKLTASERQGRDSVGGGGKESCRQRKSKPTDAGWCRGPCGEHDRAFAVCKRAWDNDCSDRTLDSLWTPKPEHQGRSLAVRIVLPGSRP
ncbi:hypothetical protein TBK1r_75760 [Stieleria magnilauensis]|uniref:Uncharacterized protein n=1 Tax=Stieleria magnilauensis TaxID=2527963 RepID=A0ABX5Y3G0_9BACT|nr:hypothetical protein TBK1r_75760 [Planctomycetes bacterium TBK1r]